MAPITDHAAYCTAMAHGLDHKLFFLGHLPTLSGLLDWGCADGKLLKEASQRGVWSVTAWDSDPAMQEAAVAMLADHGHAFVAADEETALRALTFDSDVLGNNAVLFSSVLHEMYTHQPEQMPALWERVAATNVEYIIVRDMYWGAQPNEPMGTPLRVGIGILDTEYAQQVDEFEQGLATSITYAKNLAHFLLKYPYTQNWQRELAENYFALPDLRPVLAPLGYEPIHWHPHCPDFIRERIKRDTGIELPFHTHVTAIFQRKGNLRN